MLIKYNEIVARLRKLEKPSRYADALIETSQIADDKFTITSDGWIRTDKYLFAPKPYTASISEAVKLTELLLPDAEYTIKRHRIGRNYTAEISFLEHPRHTEFTTIQVTTPFASLLIALFLALEKVNTLKELR